MIGKLFRKLQRAIDRRYVFRLIRDGAKSQEHYDKAVLIHASIDPAWRNWDEWMNDTDMKEILLRNKDWILKGSSCA